MTTTAIATFGTWDTHTRESSIADGVRAALGDHFADCDPALIEDYRAAINDALPDGITLDYTDVFHGPADADPAEVADAITDAIHAVDFGLLAAAYDTTTDPDDGDDDRATPLPPASRIRALTAFLNRDRERSRARRARLNDLRAAAAAQVHRDTGSMDAAGQTVGVSAVTIHRWLKRPMV